MAEGRMAKVMSERGRLNSVWIKCCDGLSGVASVFDGRKPFSQPSGYLRHLQRMSKAAMKNVPVFRRRHLRDVAEPEERRRVEDPIPVALRLAASRRCP